MKCTDCRYHVTQDTGYSNWTVEGCEIDCLLNKNKQLPCDGWYEEAPALDYANECDRYREGEGVEFDVDWEKTAEDYKEDIEIYLLVKSWLGE